MLREHQLAVVVAVIAVRVVKMPLDQVVDVITVGHRFMATAGSVFVLGIVAHGCALRRAAVRVLIIDGDPMLVDVILVRVVQMPTVQIVRVPFVADSEMPALEAVLVIMVGMDGVVALCHQVSFCSSCDEDHASPPDRTGPATGHENHSQHRPSTPKGALTSMSDG